MANLSREDSALMVSRVLSNEEGGFEAFYKQFHRLIHELSHKWERSIKNVAFGLYDYDDIYSELWEHVLLNLPGYDHTRANLVTWMYVVCNSKGGMVYRKHKAKFDHIGSKSAMVSINDEVYDKDGNSTELIDLIIDPRGSFAHAAIDEIRLYDFIYMLRKFIENLGHTQKVVYLNSIRGVHTDTKIGSFLGISQSYVCKIKNRLIDKSETIWDKVDHTPSSQRAAVNFSEQLLSPLSDDDLAEKLDCDLAVIKVCREILGIVDIYSYKKEA